MTYTYLILGLMVFLGAHSVRIVADDWRTRTRARMGVLPWKGLFSVVSLLGFGLLVWGFGVARQQPVQLWSPPTALRPLASLLTLIAFVLLAAAYVPGNGIKARLHHPMVLGVKAWALAHLLVNGNVAHVVLFGSFLLWAVSGLQRRPAARPAVRHALPPWRGGGYRHHRGGGRGGVAGLHAVAAWFADRGAAPGLRSRAGD